MRVELVAYDPTWPHTYVRLRRELVAVLDSHHRRIEHVGSTSVPGLSAKPVIDMVLTVDDPAHEDAYLAAVESIGFRLVRREPEWHEHRIVCRDQPATNLHVFADDCVEVGRMLRFRDRLRTSDTDRARYESVKRSLAAREWAAVQDYADAKSEIVEAILGDVDRPDA